MAINPGTLYTGKIDNSDLANYPFGKAQDITTPGDGSGTPWVASLVNDLFGFQQALLSESEVAPSGTPDTIQTSQYLDAVKKVAEDKTRYIPATNASTSISYSSADHMKYETLTNAGAITATMSAPVAPFGDTVTIDRGAGAGLVTFAGAGGVNVLTISGGSLTLDVEGQVASLVSLDATTWKLIK